MARLPLFDRDLAGAALRAMRATARESRSLFSLILRCLVGERQYSDQVGLIWTEID